MILSNSSSVCSNSSVIEMLSARQLFTELLLASGVNSQAISVESRNFIGVDFRLGDTLFEADVLSPKEPSSLNLYLIASGRVRLLSYATEKQRYVTLQSLHKGNYFGIESLVLPYPEISYKAIASSPGKLYQLPSENLIPWLEHDPNLGHYLADQIMLYQRAAFFRCVSDIQDWPGTKVRNLAGHIIEYAITVETNLEEFFVDKPGIFWLRTGDIKSLVNEPPALGQRWLGGQERPKGWQASTDLILYHVPAEICTHLDLYPALSPTSSRSGSPITYAGSVTQARILDLPTPPLTVPSLGVKSSVQDSSKHNRLDTRNPTSDEINSNVDVIFPKPLHRRVLDRMHRFPWVEQQSSSDCGAACLAMISSYWGKQLPLHILREQANVGRAGASLQGLSRAAENIGFQARPVRASLDRMASQRNPWMAHWQGDHYVVVYAINSRTVILADPAVGKRRIARSEFKKTGQAMDFC